MHSHSGLFHYALLVPERADLARWLAHAARERVQLTGASDHFVSEALYLRDPDQHGIEIYWDRPREVWEGQVADRLTTMPLDVDDILRELDGNETSKEWPTARRWATSTCGSRTCREATSFYRDALGFGLMAMLRDQASLPRRRRLPPPPRREHLGERRPRPAPSGHATLRHFTVVLPTEADRDALAGRLPDVEDSPAGPLVRDPSGNAVLLAAA